MINKLLENGKDDIFYLFCFKFSNFNPFLNKYNSKTKILVVAFLFCVVYIALLSYLNRCKEPFRITTIYILTQVLYVTAKHLDLYQVLAPNAYSYKEEFIPVIKRAVQSQVHEVGGENELCHKKRDIRSMWLVTFKCTCIIIK